MVLRMGRRTLPIALLACLLAAILPGAANAGAGKGKSQLQSKIGWGPLSSAAAAKRVETTAWEPRPSNALPNATVATPAELRYFHANSDMPYQRYVDGQFTGGTDDIIEWAANKWGLPEDALRAVAVHESWWQMSTLGDAGDSFGIFQVRRPYHCCLPFTRDSTAFNADYYGGIMRAYYDGKMGWLNNPDVRPDNGRRYRPGDFWGSVGAWVSGRWYTDQTREYVNFVKGHLRERTWVTHPYFDEQDWTRASSP